MKIFDCFTFFNELDLLEFRLEFLSDVVDYFVIVEADKTFSNKPKPYNYFLNQDRFEKWKHKIIYIPVRLNSEGLDFSEQTEFNPDSGFFNLEAQQRNGINYVRDYVSDEDLVLIGDLDEIPNPNIFTSERYLQPFSNIVKNYRGVTLSQLFHYYYFNCVQISQDTWWSGTIVVTGDIIKLYSAQQIRDQRNILVNVPLAGWHFSYLGGVEKIKTKIQSFAHQEYNRPDIINDEYLQLVIDEGKDVFNRPGFSYKINSLDQYPDYLQKVMLKYPQYIKSAM